MIIKVFKISTAEMCTIRDKKALIKFIEAETQTYVPKTITINHLLRYLPVEDYCRVK